MIPFRYNICYIFIDIPFRDKCLFWFIIAKLTEFTFLNNSMQPENGL